MISFFVRFVVFVSVSAMLAGCGQPKPTAIEKACISEGSKVAECRCMGNALKDELPASLFEVLEAKASEGGAIGLAQEMLALSEQDRHKVGNTIIEACNPQEATAPAAVGVAAPKQPLLSPDAAMSQACQINGNTPQMCDCWTGYVKENVSTQIYNILAGGVIDDGNPGLSLGMQALSEQDQMAVGLTMMEAGQVCVQP